MRVYIKEVEGLKIPKKAHRNDTGFDIYASSVPIIAGDKSLRDDNWDCVDYVYYLTNVFINLGSNEKVYVNLRPKSSIRKKRLVMANSMGLLDNGYTGEIIASFKYLYQPCDFRLNPIIEPNTFTKNSFNITTVVDHTKIYKKGEAIAQLEFLSGNMDVEFILTSPEEFAEMESKSDRKSGGHGSTGN
jgi:dUTPase